MQFFVFVSCAFSVTYKRDYSLGDNSEVKLIQGYDRALLTIPAGMGLMMVEWEDAILDISVSAISQMHARLTKHSGFSIFIFNQKASIDIIFNSQLFYSVFSGPYLSSFDGAGQLISNSPRSEFTIEKTGSDIYLKVFDQHDMTGSLKKSGTFGSAKILYYKNQEWKDTTSIESLNLQNINNHAIIRPSGGVSVQGTLYLNCNEDFTPTVPTVASISISGTIKENANNYKQTIAYGGFGSNKKQLTFNELVNTQYVTISNNIEQNQYYYLYAKDEDGNYKLIKKDDPYIETRTNDFKVEVYIRSAMGLENCTDYVYVTEIDSQILKISDFQLGYEQIKDEHIPKACYYEEKGESGKGGNTNNKKTGIIIGVVVAVVVVIIIVVVVVVVVVIKKRKSDKSSQEGKAEEA